MMKRRSGVTQNSMSPVGGVVPGAGAEGVGERWVAAYKLTKCGTWANLTVAGRKNGRSK
jgi:hypothetical protein